MKGSLLLRCAKPTIFRWHWRYQEGTDNHTLITVVTTMPDPRVSSRGRIANINSIHII